ncbi:MAG TPA: hypothetical protein VMU93_13660 [Caulobacteraceae bacterium]|nr:hypothetical protein [Caulobacteraceae bacterium]
MNSRTSRRAARDDLATRDESTDERAALALMLAVQFLAVAWIVVNQFRDHLGLDAGARSGLVAKGYIGAGLFFVAGGFLLAACRGARPLSGRFGGVLWRRLAFLYPLHLIVLGAMAAALLMAPVVGDPLHRASFAPGDLPANLLLVQAWGAVRTDSWNFPSWLISADWFSYVAYPATGRGSRSGCFGAAPTRSPPRWRSSSPCSCSPPGRVSSSPT